MPIAWVDAADAAEPAELGDVVWREDERPGAPSVPMFGGEAA
jgi:hypothetical protein